MTEIKITKRAEKIMEQIVRAQDRVTVLMCRLRDEFPELTDILDPDNNWTFDMHIDLQGQTLTKEQMMGLIKEYSGYLNGESKLMVPVQVMRKCDHCGNTALTAGRICKECSLGALQQICGHCQGKGCSMCDCYGYIDKSKWQMKYRKH